MERKPAGVLADGAAGDRQLQSQLRHSTRLLYLTIPLQELIKISSEQKGKSTGFSLLTPFRYPVILADSWIGQHAG